MSYDFISGKTFSGERQCARLAQSDAVPETASLEVRDAARNGCHVVVASDEIPSAYTVKFQPEFLGGHPSRIRSVTQNHNSRVSVVIDRGDARVCRGGIASDDPRDIFAGYFPFPCR